MCAAAIVAGIGLRFDGLARRPLWWDEAATLLHLQGRTTDDVRVLYDGRPVWAAELRPPLTADAAAIVRSVAADEPQSGLGYFLLASSWARACGDDLGKLRAFSAAASTLALPLTYCLARALFAAPDIALAATALAALSPLNVRYAQEARPYALWTALIVAAALALARLRRSAADSAWPWYGAVIGAALWVHPLTLLALPALAALALTAERHAAPRRFGIATATALATWAVWAVVCWRHRAAIALATGWASQPTDVAALGRGWLGALTAVFLRPGGEGGFLGVEAPAAVTDLVRTVSGLGVLALLVAGFRAVARRNDNGTLKFIALLTVAPWGMLALADFVLGGRRSTVDRYLAPVWIGATLAVACFVAEPGASRRRSALLAVVLALAAATAARTRRVEFWWDTDPPRLRGVAAAARAIAADHAIVVTDAPPLSVLELACQLPEDTVLQLGEDGARKIDDCRQVVLFDPSAALRAAAGSAVEPACTLAREPGLPIWRGVPVSR